MLALWAFILCFALDICLIVGSKSYLSKKSLYGRVALVTGASRGIGKGIAIELAEAGATVYITGRSRGGNSTDPIFGGTLEETLDEITQFGGKAIAISCDHSKDEDVENVFKKIEADVGRLDILVNNAFQTPRRPDGIEDKDLLFRNFWEQPGTAPLSNITDNRTYFMPSVMHNK